ncbi:MAG: DEAD/DEAH box helicase [Alphaproteobacteria bacterium]|nr:DEAD/DEAH box helicase [Alphaproteobacteria bacterium]
MSFKDLGLSDEVLRAVSDAGYETPTPIQEKAIPYVLMNRDIMGCAQTGTGKTAGFTLPMIDILSHGRAKARLPRSLILEPTRELADQVAKNFEIYGKYQKLSKALLIGGVAFDEQFRLLDRGVDVLIATPGRLLDHFERGKVLLSDIKILVIDEADRMLDMGFIPDVERIVSLMPKIRQTLMFSATMPTEIRRLASQFLMNPKEMAVDPPATAAELVEQKLAIVGPKDKREALRNILRGADVKNALIFCNRKRDVGVVHRSLVRHGFDAGALHGDMEQWQRMETLDAFKKGEFKFLVCSDVAARGLDIEAMSHVINFDVPSHAEDYIHRIGRTGRAGLKGMAITLATGEDARYLAAVERLLGFKIERIEVGAVQTAEMEPVEDRKRSRRRGGRKRRSAQAPETTTREPAPPAETQPRAASTTRPAEDERPHKRSHHKKQAAKENEATGGKTSDAKDKSKAESSKKPFGSDEDVPAFLRKPVRA